jgi:hypothetical protein
VGGEGGRGADLVTEEIVDLLEGLVVPDEGRPWWRGTLREEPKD